MIYLSGCLMNDIYNDLLKHKNRAFKGWDTWNYDELVVKYFPGEFKIYKPEEVLLIVKWDTWEEGKFLLDFLTSCPEFKRNEELAYRKL